MRSWSPIDFAGQEVAAGRGPEPDANMLACLSRDNLKDMHSMTASGGHGEKLGSRNWTELIPSLVQDGDDDYALFLRLRKLAGDEHKDAVGCC